MWRVEVACSIGEEEIVLARFTAFDLAAADTGEGWAKAWFANHDEARRCAGELNGQICAEPIHNWNENWQSEWKPQAIGRRLWLTPPWDESEAPAGRIRLNMHPGTLFGNGDHPTTQLCLEALEEHITPGCTVIDVGCGSGLLIEAARLLGSDRAIGCDLDPAAAKTAPCAFQGSVDALASGCADIVIANIQLGVLETLMPELNRVLRPSSGILILSGILEEQISGVPRQPRKITTRDGWACLVV